MSDGCGTIGRQYLCSSSARRGAMRVVQRVGSEALRCTVLLYGTRVARDPGRHRCRVELDPGLQPRVRVRHSSLWLADSQYETTAAAMRPAQRRVISPTCPKARALLA